MQKELRFATHFKAWSAEVDGVQGKVAAPLLVRQQVWMLIYKLVSWGWLQGRASQSSWLPGLHFPVPAGTLLPPAPHLYVHCGHAGE